MVNSSATSNRRSLVRRPFKEFLSRLSNSADQTGLASANHLAGSQTIVSKPSTSSVLVQSSSKTVAVSPTAHSVSTSPALADPLARNILNAALQHLEQREREIIEEYISPDDGVPSLLLTIYTACQEKRELCEKRRWTFTLRGRTVRLRDEVDNVTKWLDRFKQVGDIAVNADPIHAGLPWAGIRLLLEAATTERRQMAALLEGLKTVLYMINRLDLYLSYLRELPHFQSHTQFEDSIVQFYALILEFLASAIRVYKKHAVSRAFEAFWKLDEVIEFESKCDKLANRVEIDAQNCDRKVMALNARDFREQLEQLRELRDMSNPINEIWNNLKEGEQAKILEWISRIPYADDHESASEGRTKGTAEWIFDRPEYQEWETSPKSQILWLHGILGAGKTKLTANVINHVSGGPDDEAVAYFYCDRDVESRRDPGNVLRCFVKQLATSRDEQAIQDSVVRAYKGKLDTGFASAQLTYKEAEALLPQLMQAYSRTTLVLDALDECYEKSRLKLIHTFNHFIQDSPLLKIFISSRCDEDIKHQLEREANLGITATDNQNDIAKFIQDTIDADESRRRFPLSNGLRNQIVQTLFDKSAGMFQWASVQINDLLSHEREADIQKCLGQLPDGLTEAYNKIFAAIKSQKGSKLDIAIRTFQWIIASVAPLDSEAFVAAVCQDPDHYTPQPIDIDINFVLSACRNLVVADLVRDRPYETRVFRFSHLSVREYFEQHQSQIAEQSNEVVGKVYLSLLKSPGAWDLQRWQINGDMGVDSDLRGLMEYVGTFWPNQLRYISQNTVQTCVTALLQQFLISEGATSRSYKEWHNWFGSDVDFYPQGRIREVRNHPLQHFDELDPPDSALLPICLFGFTPFLVDQLKRKDEIINIMNSNESPLLYLAVLGGNKAIVRLLLENGADANARLYGKYGSALAAAAHQDNEEIVRLLLHHRADVNAKLDGEYGSALAAAANANNEEIVRLLLHHRADVNAKLDGDYGSALAAAANANNEEIVRLLLHHGADANAQLDGDYGSALAAAADADNEEIVQLLLRHGADANAMLDGNYGSALAAAANADNEEIVQLLLRHGADANAKLGGDYGSALAAAANAHNKQMVRLLLEKGADPNIRIDGNYGSALAAAANVGNKGIVELLLEEGANPNAQLAAEHSSIYSAVAFRCFLPEYSANANEHLGEGYGSALAAAANGGHKEIVELLLEKGVNPNAQLYGEYGSALAAAAAAEIDESNKEVVELLLRKGAKANTKLRGHYGSALAAAANKDDVEIVELLLQNGAEVNAQLGGHFGSAFVAAANGGSKDVVELLFETGANANAERDGDYGSALAAAAAAPWAGFKGKKIVQFLLKKGANPNAQLGGGYGSALAAAANKGDVEIVELLLQNGAEVNARLGGHFGSALAAAAAKGGNEEIIRLLLQHGADANAKLDGVYGSALAAAAAAAAHRGNKKIVQLLLEKGADPNVRIDGGYGSALAAAAFRGNETIIRLLLKNHAAVNAQGGRLGNALTAATYSGNEAIVRLLLETHADANAQGGWFGNALTAAAYRGHEAIVGLLLQYGADANAVRRDISSMVVEAIEDEKKRRLSGAYFNTE